MKVLIVGNGISGLSAAIRSAELGHHVIMVSPYVSERSQSVLAAGGINAALDTIGENDSTQCHFEETMKGGAWIEGSDAVRGLCESAPEIIRWLESIGVVFSRNKNGKIAQRAFGGQSKRRTAYAGASTGKQIVTALVQKCREYEISGTIERRLGAHFHSALIDGGRCYGAVFSDDVTGEIFSVTADAVIMAVGGMNKLFGKTTGSELCDAYAAGRLMSQGVMMRNLEFIQYHPTTIETQNKRMLISEAARGEGGRLYYMKDGKRVYFMEEQFGKGGDLMPRDVVSRCIYACPSQVYLDVSFLGAETIHERLEEIYEMCMKYLDLDICKESIPVAPSVHFFMGGIKTDDEHRTNIQGLYAVGECASKYHGANRLGGNSLLAAIYSGRTAADSCDRAGEQEVSEPVSKKLDEETEAIRLAVKESMENVSAAHDGSVNSIHKELADIMNKNLGIVRDEEGLSKGIAEIDGMIKIANAGICRSDMPVYMNERTAYMLLMAKAILMSALAREESRGAHYRSDHPETKDSYCGCSTAGYKDGDIVIGFERTKEREDIK